jgi:hypothetical protein
VLRWYSNNSPGEAETKGLKVFCLQRVTGVLDRLTGGRVRVSFCGTANSSGRCQSSQDLRGEKGSGRFLIAEFDERTDWARTLERLQESHGGGLWPIVAAFF